MEVSTQYIRSWYLYPVLLLSLVSIPIQAIAVDATPLNQAPFSTWSMIIGSFVCLVAASVAYLCYGSVRHWSGFWRILALIPLVILTLLIAFYVLNTVVLAATRPLWTFEVLLWAMATTIYLVTLFTAKRAFEKADSSQ